MPTRLFYGAGEQHYGDLSLPEGAGPFPVVLLVHGGFWKAAYGLHLMDEMAEDFVARGYAVWNIEYRRVGHDGGGWPGTLLDVADAADFLRTVAREHPLDLTRVIAIGHSAGGHLALWLAARHRLSADSILHTDDPLKLSGVVSLAGVSDLEQMWEIRQQDSPVANFLGGTPAEVPDRYRQACPTCLLPLGTRVVLIHGTDDDNVPHELSAKFLMDASVAGDDVTMVSLKGVEHFKVITPGSEAWPAVVEALQKLT